MFRKFPPWAMIPMVLLGLVLMAISCFDKGTLDTGDPRLMQPTCEDLRQRGQDTTGCQTAEEILNADGGVDNWPLFVIGLLVLLFGIGVLVFRGRTDPPDRPTAETPLR